MTLTEQSAQYIKEIGVEKAAEQFGKKPSTIKRWISTNEYPVAVAEASQVAQSAQINQIPEPANSSEPVDAVYQEPEKPNLGAYDPKDILEEHHQALNIILQRLSDVEQFLTRITAPPPPPPPAPEPRVVTGQPVDNSNIRPVFATRLNIGGPANPNPVPETKPDTYGASMKSLLTPYNYAQRRR